MKKRFDQGSHIVFSYISLLAFNLEQSLCFKKKSFITLSVLKSPIILLENVPHSDVSHCFLMSRFRLNIFWQEYPIGDDVAFPVRPIRRHMSLACLITGGVKFSHLAKESLCFTPYLPLPYRQKLQPLGHPHTWSRHCPKSYLRPYLGEGRLSRH